MKKTKGKKEVGTSFGDNLGWLILYLVVLAICSVPMSMAAVIDTLTKGVVKPSAELERIGSFFAANGILISFILMLIVFLFVLKKKKEALLVDVKKFNSDKKRNILLALGGMLFMLGCNIFLTDVIRPHLFTSVTTENQAALVSMVNENTPVYSLISYLLLLGILIPFFEEVFCRFNFRKSFKSTTVFIIVTSLIFGAMHIPSWNISFELIYDLSVYVFLGVCMAYVYCKTESICSSMIMHMLNNIFSVFIMILPFLK